MKTLLKKINQISSEIGHVRKEGFNDFHKYSYVTEADVIESLKPHMNRHGVVIIPSIKEVRAHGDITTVLVDYTIGCVDSDEKIVCQWAGTGQDKGDKGLYKALTGAEKYFLMKTFMIASSDDPENEKHESPRSYVAAPIAGPAQNAIIKVGKKHAGKRYDEVPYEELKSYANWLKNDAASKNKKLSADAAEFISRVESMSEPAFTRDVPPPGDEDLPF